ncbi:MAG TPA: helix-turn-helix domain-containing protein, partial [Planctomycetota bacterium]|nr:helix-turn-helix domain-containing protein [Planctomycetota bacterium]
MVEYFSFEEVMRELELSEEDLKRMVSEGELRAFRDENKMKFKREDVEHLKKGRITEPTII